MLLRIATRRSPLALAQYEEVARRLSTLDPTLAVEAVALTTRGDEYADRSLAPIGGKGLFISALEDALCEGRADCAVHSLKDVPVSLDPRFELLAILPRGNPLDCLIGADTLGALPKGARVGTSSLRRQSQILARRPDIRVEPVRGSVGARLDRLARGEFEALVLARAGLERLGAGRLGMDPARATELDADESVPAIGQGALAIECLRTRAWELRALTALHDPETAACVAAERAFGVDLGVDCTAPVGAFACQADDGGLTLLAYAGSADGHHSYRDSLSGREPDALGRKLAQRFHEQGIRNFIAQTP
ncbi:MAG: hydroxymethylbilane synthase [Gammaproteobacteria bacterium]